MRSTNLLKYTLLATSILLIALAVVSFCFTGHALRILAIQFPGGTNNQWIWMGPDRINPTQEAWDTGRVYRVTLMYQWTTENLVWVTSSLSVITGLVGIVVFVRAVKYGEHSIYQLSNTSWINISPLVLSSLTCLLTLSSFIWASVNYSLLKNSTCNPWDSDRSRKGFVCSRELVACELLPFLGPWENEDERERACWQMRGARMSMVPLAGLALVLLAVLAVQMKRGMGMEQQSEKIWVPETWDADTETHMQGEGGETGAGRRLEQL